MTAITSRQKRRLHDFYPTPAWATQELLARVPQISGTILECCSGDGAIASVLSSQCQVVTNDIDVYRNSDLHFDAADQKQWIDGDYDWIITNPPFSSAPSIVPLAYSRALVGIAFVLRLSYLEPCKDRIEWLLKHPVTQLIVLPRISFTSDGKKDQVTCAWFLWIKGSKEQSIEIIPRRYNDK